MKKARPLLDAIGKAADKPNPNTWRQEGAAWVLKPGGSVEARLAPEGARWGMRLAVLGKTFYGTRDTMEEAFKALDGLLYQEAKKVWLKSNCTAVIAPWGSKIPEE